MQEVVGLVKGWQQRRRGLAVHRRLPCAGQIIEAMAVRGLEGRHHRQQPVHTSGPRWAVGPQARLAPQPPWPNGPLGDVVRGRALEMAHNGPQRLASLEDLPAAPAVLGTPHV